MPTKAEVRSEQVAAVFRQTPLAILVSAVNAALMTAVLDDGDPKPRMFVWLAAVLVVASARLALWWIHETDHSASQRFAGWGAVGTGAAALAGSVWGAGAAWLWPQSEAHQLFWVFAVGGMCAGAAVLHYAHLPTALGFILPAGLPVAGRFAMEGSGRGLAAAAMVVVFLAALTVTIRRSSTHFGEYLRLRLDLAQHARELDAANAKLRREMEDHRATEASLRHAQKTEAVGQLTGGIAHDFNNLLTAVLGSLALLRKRLPAADQRTVRLLDNASEAAKRGAVLTQRLLAFGRRQALRTEAVDLPDLVRGMSDLLRRSIGAGHRLDIRFANGLPPVLVDANQLELALLNLALNARDAMPEGGDVRIAAREHAIRQADGTGLPTGAYVVLSVSDTGEGMDEATLARATEPFFTTKGIGKGTGLGLSMAHGMAAQSGGRLILQSRKGAGTVAELWLPRADHLPSRPYAEPEQALSATARQRVVLLVDDDPLVLTCAAAMLEDLGHRVVEAESGERALEHLRTGVPVDLVITDYGMPGMTGLELVDKLRRLEPNPPVIIATGYGEVPTIDTAGLARLSKPYGQETLNAAINRSLDGHRGGRDPA